MLNNIAKAISYFFHPVFIPLLIFITLYYFAPLPVFLSFFTFRNLIALGGVIFLYTILLPILATLWMKRTRFISDLENLELNVRPKVYFIVSAFYGSLAYFLYSKGGLLAPTGVLLMTFTINILGLALMSFFSKISSHVSAIAGAVGVFIALYLRFFENGLYGVILVSILLWGTVATARLILGAHTPKQITIGGLWGLLTGFIGTYWFLLK